MAAIVGTNAYISNEDFKSWCDDRAYDYTSYSEQQVNAAIVVSGSDYIDVNYTFKGTALDDTQPMQLPTDCVAISDILNAAAQAAWQQLNGLLFVTQTASSAKGDIKMERNKLDKLEKEVEYTEGTANVFKMNTTTIDRLLQPYLAYQSNAIRVLL